MSLSTSQCLTAIEQHSRWLARVARRDLAAAVEHCPSWDVADLVRHVSAVHRFWGAIAEHRLTRPPDFAEPPPVDSDHLVPSFLTGVAHLVDVLRSADQSAHVWTWYPPRQDIGFITRHQVQEAAVHHWDAAHATGAAWSMEPAAAADAVEEFLTCSLADADDAARIGATLPGAFTLEAQDTGNSWTVRQAGPGAALLWEPGSEAPTVRADAADLLLWIYRRVELPVRDARLVAAFRALSSTD
ncbi:maleylpyruvate isomerase family mycothiol-dependent enzyme [Nocardioides terrisoli]|uniref:maleylpyruvate isomerase family mycothiol-dependent enzyme n=1 Tax=Nocardioides terrisoli TaxID=3388267 RepID=UPI00287BC7F3|nr:maleylpyruvate isomerase family mycothiol-dependent enzyme [Nocardioides marmorisolisilvae]